MNRPRPVAKSPIGVTQGGRLVYGSGVANMPQRFASEGVLAMEPAAWGRAYAAGVAGGADLFEEINGVAVVNIRGPLTHYGEWFWDSYPHVVKRVAAALESSAKAVILRIDSPGGDCAGCFEAAAAIAAAGARAEKPIYAQTDGTTASAAYALACAAAGGIYLSPTARMGSVGTIGISVDQSALDQSMGLNFAVVSSGARKADGNPHVPLTEGALAAMQAQIDELAEHFFAHVAAARSLSVDDVRAQEAAMFIGARAVEAGLADGVATFDELVAQVTSGTPPIRERTKEATEMNLKEMIAELRKAAEGDGEDADKAKKMLAALEDDGEDKDKPKEKAEGDGDDKPEEKAEGDGDDKPKEGAKAAEGDDDDKDKPKDGAKAVTSALAATVNRMSAELAAMRKKTEASERQQLIASRPDLAPELVEVLEKKDKTGAFVTPMSTVRDICEAKSKKKETSKANPAAALGARPTQAAGQGGIAGGGVTRASAEADRLDQTFGLSKPSTFVKREGGTMTFGAMTADEARKHLEATKKEVG